MGELCITCEDGLVHAFSISLRKFDLLECFFCQFLVLVFRATSYQMLREPSKLPLFYGIQDLFKEKA